MNEIVTTPKAELVAGNRVAPIVPRTVEEVFRVAQAVVGAGLAPSSYDNNPQKIVIGIMKGAEVGLPPITALSTIAIINNRPCLWGDGAMALVSASGKLKNAKEYFEGQESDDSWTAVCELQRDGQDDPVVRRFSVADAKRAHLWQNPKRSPWMQYPQRMLQMRARSWAMRDGFADFLCGLSIAEEAQDIPQAAPPTDLAFLDDAPALPPPSEEPIDTSIPEDKPKAEEPIETESGPNDTGALKGVEPDEEDADRGSAPCQPEASPDPFADGVPLVDETGEVVKTLRKPMPWFGDLQTMIGKAQDPQALIELNQAGALHWCEQNGRSANLWQQCREDAEVRAREPALGV